MKVRLDQVRFEPFDWQETQDVPAAALDRPELVRLGPVSWRGHVQFADPGFYLRARLSYDQTLTCNRCLKAVTEPVTGDLQLAIFVEDPHAGAGERELRERDMGVLQVAGEVLETEPILLEQLQLNIPMKPLCRPECQGLCPLCGADLNLGACDCTEPPGDPRWAALAGLRDRLNDH